MLIHLRISNFAIIKQLEISLEPGLNILSGETGAGKSIIINAVNLILGGRASSDLIRSRCKEAGVEALFSVSGNRQVEETLSELGLPADSELLIKRSISREGRNKVLINGSLATLQGLSRLGPLLISISGQHENQFLLKPDHHLYILDDFGGLSEERAELGALYGRMQSAREEIEALEKEIQEAETQKELAAFQIQEIERAQLTPDEDAQLLQEKGRLQNAEALISLVSGAYQNLYERENSALSTVAQSLRDVERGVDMDGGLARVRDALAEIQARLEDAAFALRELQGEIRADPQRLETVLDRLDLLNRLKRKYGASIEEVLQFKERLASGVHDLEEKRQKRDELGKARETLSAAMTEKASALSAKRTKTARSLEKAVERELQKLHMVKTRFQVRFEGPVSGPVPIHKIREDGYDRVEFMISPNVGEEMRPLVKIASGGELSRIMLAMKTILARSASIETVIFDEVDAGISGATADVVGEKLHSLSKIHQTLCITHLPQIASQGKTHFLVKKEVSEGRTEAVITELEEESRVQEIARLLGGREITPSAVAHAREMLNQ